MDGAPKVRAGMGDGSTAGAAAGTAVFGPGIGTAVGGIVGSFIKTGSPRYEGGPLLSTVQNRLAALRAGDPTAISQTHQDAITGGPGWKDVATVLAPYILPNVFGQPSRPLNAADYQALGPYAVTGGGPIGASKNAPITSFNAGSGSLAGVFGGGNSTMLLVAGLGLFVITKLVGGGRRARR